MEIQFPSVDCSALLATNGNMQAPQHISRHVVSWDASFFTAKAPCRTSFYTSRSSRLSQIITSKQYFHLSKSTASLKSSRLESLNSPLQLQRNRFLPLVKSRCSVQNVDFATTIIPCNTSAPLPPQVTNPSPLTIDQFHRLSDAYIDTLVAHLEDIQEEREEVDVEYSAGVLTLKMPPAGTYVLNKQPPNKQIWLSSPISGPKRYDWVERAGTAYGGEWTYLRDGSTLDALLATEINVEMGNV